MKKYILFGIVLMMGFLQQGKTQTVDEIINKYLEANGGIEKLKQLKSVVKTGVLATEEQEATVKMYNHNLTGYKIEFEMDGVKNYELANAKEGFTYFPSFGQEEILPMQEDRFRQALFDLNILPAFVNYAEKNNTIEFKGVVETKDGVAYKLELSTEEGNKIDYFIDNKTGYLIKTIFHANSATDVSAREITYADFRVVADKFIFPFTIENNMGTLQFSTIEVNVPIKETVFKFK